MAKRLTDLVGFGLTVIVHDEDGSRVLETLEDVENEQKRQEEKRKNRGVK